MLKHVADGVASEIRYARETNKPVRYFSLKNLPNQMTEIKEVEVEFEPGLVIDDLKP